MVPRKICHRIAKVGILLFIAGGFVTLALGQNNGVLQGGPSIKEISLKDLNLLPVPPAASPNKPMKIINPEELAKAFPDKDTQNRIAKQVDFSKQYLLYFRWSGSGGDKINLAASSDDLTITFIYTAGETDDLRHHAKLFALAKGVPWKFKQ